jgi:hypothetical protein
MYKFVGSVLAFALLAVVPLFAVPDPLAISGVNAAATPESVTVSWLTNVPATSRVEWGTSATNLPFNKSDAAYVTNHSLTLTGLTPGTVYYIVITSVGEQGETVRYTVSQPKPEAAPPAPAPAPAPRNVAAPAADDGWHFGFTPYLWFPGMHGTTGTELHPVNIRASAGDVLSHFNIGIMGAYEVRKKRFVYLGDLLWIKLGDDKSLTNLDPNVTVDAKLYNLLFSQAAGVRVVDKPKLKIDGVGGFRLWYLSTDLNFSNNVASLNVNKGQTWVDPIVGSRILLPLSEKALFTVYGDVGGWGAGSQLEYQVMGALGYRIKPKIMLQAGWRYLFVDYTSSTATNGTFQYKVAETGPIFGVRFELK